MMLSEHVTARDVEQAGEKVRLDLIEEARARSISMGLPGLRGYDSGQRGKRLIWNYSLKITPRTHLTQRNWRDGECSLWGRGRVPSVELEMTADIAGSDAAAGSIATDDGARRRIPSETAAGSVYEFRQQDDTARLEAGRVEWTLSSSRKPIKY